MNERIKRPRSTDNKGDKTQSKYSLFKKRKGCPLAGVDVTEINYKNPELLIRFISEGGRKLPRRITGVSSPKQRMLKKQISIARILALLPFTNRK